MGYNSRKIKERAEELSEGYTEARNDAFRDKIMDMVDDYLGNVDEDAQLSLEGLADTIVDDFTFQSMWDWSYDEATSELDDIGDQKYEQMRDERMGL